ALMSRSIRAAIAVAITAVTILGTTQQSATAASAPNLVRRHMALTKSEPKSDDTVTSPKAIKLWFSEKVAASAVTIKLTDSKHAMIALGKVTVAAGMQNAPAVATIASSLATGQYDVEWKALASDGHPASGKFLFQVK
ncbi:MAG: copper resistance protein CopC, partial [Gemmatimonadaceae bacterium]